MPVEKIGHLLNYCNMSLTGKSSEGSKVIHHSAWTSIWVTVAYVSPIIGKKVTGTSFVGLFIHTCLQTSYVFEHFGEEYFIYFTHNS